MSKENEQASITSSSVTTSPIPRGKPLHQLTEEALSSYFRGLEGTQPHDLYGMVLSEVERPLFKAVMDFCRGNQSRAAEVLGINRGTLRKKLKTYGLLH
ncbi:MAG: DNA-binding transcriptional regulator Fis [Gammaproteobacteria bacterium]|nr:DNA-binding transcriptional regulator Fis [Gammaproteobacteria bacterium]